MVIWFYIKPNHHNNPALPLSFLQLSIDNGLTIHSNTAGLTSYVFNIQLTSPCDLQSKATLPYLGIPSLTRHGKAGGMQNAERQSEGCIC